MERPEIKLAIYDMDKTVTRRPTYTPFLLHAARTRKPWRLLLLPLVGLTVLLYFARAIDRAKLKELNHALLVGAALPPAEATMLANSFAKETMATNTLKAARVRIAEEKADGFRHVLATASYEFYSGAIGRALGFDHVIGTMTRTDTAGALLARIAEENCYGPVKLRMIEAWMTREGIVRDACHIRFYSDHVSDAPSFEWADEAFATNAHAPLVDLARQRGWTVLDWR